MTKQQIISLLVPILSTLNEVGGISARTPIYMALGMDLTKYLLLENILIDVGWVTATAQEIKLTPAGTAKAVEIDALLSVGKK